MMVDCIIYEMGTKMMIAASKISPKLIIFRFCRNFCLLSSSWVDVLVIAFMRKISSRALHA